MDYVDMCPPAVVEKVQTADLGSSDNGALFAWIAGEAPLDCQVSALVGVARRMNRETHPQVVADFCGSVATYARFLKPADLAVIREAYLRFPYADAMAMSYFGGLIATGIDIREHLRDRIAEDWTFTHPRRDAATWHYYKYLASLGEPGALDRIAGKIADTKNGNDATNLLDSISDLKAPGVTDLLKSYAGDTRRADGTEEPGMMISENVQLWLMLRGDE